jgi:hypothetical protein
MWTVLIGFYLSFHPPTVLRVTWTLLNLNKKVAGYNSHIITVIFFWELNYIQFQHLCLPQFLCPVICNTLKAILSLATVTKIFFVSSDVEMKLFFSSLFPSHSCLLFEDAAE